MKHYSFNLAAIPFAVLMLSLNACTPKMKPVVTNLTSVETVAPQPAGNIIDRGNTTQVVTEVTLSKSEILNREFLYGSDLQYSAISDEEFELTLQALAIGHVPAKFFIVGSNLQLIADNSIKFESDINKPGQLIFEFPILKETADTLTVKIERASPTLVTVLFGKTAQKERSSWVRSVKYVESGNYLMWESSIEAADGSIAEFMESVFPRDTLVKPTDQPLFADAALEELAERFRFLTWGSVFMNVGGERIQTQVANRFKVEQGPILWYVTPNVPDAYLDQIRTGIEAWNRYSQASTQKNDLVKFEGKLPPGVKIGDPRYNIVNWDSVAEAGAAYESQASDPLTGIQSHSLIYIPYAWVNIGRDYWKLGEFSDKAEKAGNQFKKAIANRSFLGKKLSVSCVNNAHAHLHLKSLQDPEEFAKELLKGVLFHEMGHALGLAHNFKGSLSMDTDDASTPFTTSIMDYNQYQIERKAFDSVDAATGPLLEYDRQIVSVLYNQGKDIVGSPVVPACNDDEADSVVDGVDPLCIRYDSGKDPTRQLEAAIDLVSRDEAEYHGTQSLAFALRSSKSVLKDVASATSIEVLDDRMKQLATTARGLVTFYFGSGAQSIRSMAISNVRQLYIFQNGSLPETYSETQMRQRALTGIKFIATLEKLPESTTLAIDKLLVDAEAFIKQSPAYAGLTDSEKANQVVELLQPLTALKGNLENPTTGVLSRIRTRVLPALVREKSAPFYLARNVETGEIQDVEETVLKLLEANLTNLVSGKTKRSIPERLATVSALKTFADTDAGVDVLNRVSILVKAELSQATSAREREALRALLAALK
jgi:hypothetical protein